MTFNVLDENLKLIAIVDEFISLIWCVRYNEIGGLDLEIEATQENVDLFKLGRYITRDDDDNIFRIEAIEYNDRENNADTLIIGGVDLQSIIKQRICTKDYTYDTVDLDVLIYDLINGEFINTSEERKIPLVIDKDSLQKITITGVCIEKGTNVGDEIIKYCQKYGWGFKINKDLHFTLYEGGIAISNLIYFSREFDSLINSKYNINNSDLKNCCLVKGKTSGDSYVYEMTGEATGLNRREMYIDSGLEFKASQNFNQQDFINSLHTVGQNEISQKQKNKRFECEISTDVYTYKVDYWLGLIVYVKNDVASAHCRIVEVTETWDDNGYTLEPVLEILGIDERSTGYILTEKKENMTTEKDEKLKLEEA